MSKQVYHFDVTPSDIAGLFMTKGWKWASTPVAILPHNIQNTIESLVRNLVKSGAGYSELGRFIVFRDAEFPGGYEIALKIGYVKTNVPDDLDAIPEVSL